MEINPPVMDPDDIKLIQSAYRKMLTTFKDGTLNETDRVNIRNAFEIAVSAHSKQRRKSGEPYILHPIEVARICVEEIGLGPTAVVCALLHDTIEDTEVTYQDIETQFGNKIADIVNGLTKLDSTYEMENLQAENFRKVLNTLLVDVRVVLIKLADRLHNMRTLGSMPRHKQLKIASETNYIYAPLAHRLGLYKIKTELQDICLKITDPEVYKEIATKLSATKKQRDEYMERFIEPIKPALDELGVKYKISGRPKSIYSIYNKIQSKDVSFEDIFDLFAIRIIFDNSETLLSEKDLSWFIYSRITDIYNPLPDRLKDMVSTPKSNGYQSLHSTVIGLDGRYVEVQIRSMRMDEIAEKGFAAHYKYKGVNRFDDIFDNFLDRVRMSLEDQEDVESNLFLEDFKATNLPANEITVVTPKGDMKVMPDGSTGLDFAFSLHSEIGYHCSAIKINNKLVPMGTKLKSGDQVTVFTSNTQKPNEDWLKIVNTGRAKAKIRLALKEERKKLGEPAKEMLQRKLAAIKAKFDDINIDLLTKYFEVKGNRVDFFYNISLGVIDLKVLKKFKVDNGRLVLPIVLKSTTEANTKRKTVSLGLTKDSLLIDGEAANTMEFSYATCCNPVPGDDVFAFNGVVGGYKIHRTNCPNATNLMAHTGYRIKKAEWGTYNKSTFSANILITGVDEGPGVIERLTNKISKDLGLNIRSLFIAADEGYFEGKLSIYVQNKSQLDLTVRTLKSLKGVMNVLRVE
jgi:GTP diphosphokinase / guanosine-3',5'-bis(diphosphate) 3'-diphosphatase